MIEDGDLVVHTARFAGALRDRGIAVGIGDEIDATRALALIDISDRQEIRRALVAALKIRPRDRAAFDELFDIYWSAGGATAPQPRPGSPPVAVRGALARRPIAGRVPHPAGEETAEAGGEAVAYSPEVALRRKPFDECSATDLAAMEALLARWTPRWAARRGRRLRPTKGRGLPDVRRSFRRALATGGEMLSLARRRRPIDEPRLVVLCDTSGSMDAHVRFLLAFVLALKRVARRTEVFAFNTSLTRLTPWLSPGRIGPTLERLAAGVSDWSGGTRIGESLSDLLSTHDRVLVRGKSVVVIVSDGLDRGDTARVSAAMRSLRAKARRIVWLNPLSGDPRYEPTARAMAAALPFIDRFGPAHNLESLERLLPELTT